MSTYDLSYDCCPLCTVTIDGSPKADRAVREMVEFCSGGEEWYEKYDCYEKAFCHRLMLFLLRCHRLPGDGDEGYYPLDGSYGVTVSDFTIWEPDDFNFEIDERP